MRARSFVLVSAVALVLATGCRKPKSKPASEASGPVGVTAVTSGTMKGPKASAKIERLLARLQSPDEITRDNASKELLRLKRTDLEIDDSLALVHAAAKPWPKRKEASTAADLLRVAQLDARKEHAESVPPIYEKLDALARTEALALLSLVDDRAAIEAFVKLVKSDVEHHRTTDVRADSLDVAKNHANILFPTLLEHAKGRAAGGIFGIAIALIEADALKPESLVPYTSTVVAAWNDLRPKLGKERYEELRHANWTLDLMAWLPKADVLPSLKEALTNDDALISYWGAVGLLTHKQQVPTKHIEAIASHAELRGYLYDKLKTLGAAHLFPAKHRNQRALAEAEMARFLQEPAHAGRPPSQIEVVEVVSERFEKDVYDLYLFRFRVDAPSPVVPAERTYEWMAGTAGPFRRGALTTKPLATSHSTYKPYVEKTVAEHRELAKTQLHAFITGDADEAESDDAD